MDRPSHEECAEEVVRLVLRLVYERPITRHSVDYIIQGILFHLAHYIQEVSRSGQNNP